MDAPLSPLSSRAQPRDLQFYGPFLENIFDRSSAVEGPAVLSSRMETLIRKGEAVKHIAGRDCNVLFSIHGIAHCSGGNRTPGLEMPQRLS